MYYLKIKHIARQKYDEMYNISAGKLKIYNTIKYDFVFLLSLFNLDKAWKI